MRVLGIDPGLRTTGFGVVECDGGRLRYVASGTIRTAAVALGDLPGAAQGHLRRRARDRRRATRRPAPRSRSSSSTSIRRRRCCSARRAAPRSRRWSSHELAVAEYTALQMKQAIVGHGQAKKEQVQQMVMRLLAPARPARPGRRRRARPGDLPRPRRRQLRRDRAQRDAGAAHLRALQERSNLLKVRIRRWPAAGAGRGSSATIGAP